MERRTFVYEELAYLAIGHLPLQELEINYLKKELEIIFVLFILGICQFQFLIYYLRCVFLGMGKDKGESYDLD